jgi:ABC-2 type transport system permease protein
VQHMSVMARGAREPTYDSAAFKLPLVHELRELFQYRFLVWNLITRDLKVRYKRSVLGFVWVMLNPLLTMAVLTIVFSQIFRFNVSHYAVYVLSGTLLWTLFAQGSNAAMGSLQASGAVIRKLYVPPSVFVASAVGSAVVNFMFALGPFLILSIVDHITIRVSWLFLIYPAFLTVLFTMGIGLIVGALIVFFNDTFEIYQVLLQAYYFFTPVFYPIKTLPEPIRTIEGYSPMYLFLSSFRGAVMYNQVPGEHMFRATLIALGTLAVGWIFFTRVEGKFVYQF